MENTMYIQIFKEKQDLYKDILPLWLAYFNELREGEDNEKPTEGETIHDLNRRINIQGRRPDMHFELFYCDDIPVGFANFAIDTGGISGLIEKGYGFVMEFYIAPEFRRKGYGQLFYEHIEKTLINDGTQNIYLTSDTVTGVPFWVAMGFSESGKIDPDNNLPIFIKNI
jgi:GNAT superfamily N-acetyltransferase